MLIPSELNILDQHLTYEQANAYQKVIYRQIAQQLEEIRRLEKLPRQHNKKVANAHREAIGVLKYLMSRYSEFKDINAVGCSSVYEKSIELSGMSQGEEKEKEKEKEKEEGAAAEAVTFPEVETYVEEEARAREDHLQHPIDKLAIGISDLGAVKTIEDLPERVIEGGRFIVESISAQVVAADNEWRIFDPGPFWHEYNINDRVRFKFAEGCVLDDLPIYWRKDGSGYIETELHDLMRVLGKHMIMGSGPIIERNSIELQR